MWSQDVEPIKAWGCCICLFLHSLPATPTRSATNATICCHHPSPLPCTPFGKVPPVISCHEITHEVATLSVGSSWSFWVVSTIWGGGFAGTEKQETINSHPPSSWFFHGTECQRQSIKIPSQSSLPATFSQLQFHSSLPRSLNQSRCCFWKYVPRLVRNSKVYPKM